MALDPVVPRSRRALLLGGLGGLAAAALGSLARPDRAAAADGDPLTLGTANSSATVTTLTQATAATGGLKVTSASGTAIEGDSTSSRGVFGNATSGVGVQGAATTGTALVAGNSSTTKPALTARNANATTTVLPAIQAVAGGALPAAQKETAIEGSCNLSVNSVGVYGGSADGYGVVGDSSASGYGVGGFGYYGVYGNGVAGVVGDVDAGTGVQGWTGVAVAPDPLQRVGVLAGAENGRTALQVNGVGKFNRSGRSSIAVGTSSKKITVPGGVTTAAFGIATLQTNRVGYYVQAVVPSASTSTITIYLNKAVTTTAISVGWIVFS